MMHTSDDYTITCRSLSIFNTIRFISVCFSDRLRRSGYRKSPGPLRRLPTPPTGPGGFGPRPTPPTGPGGFGPRPTPPTGPGGFGPRPTPPTGPGGLGPLLLLINPSPFKGLNLTALFCSQFLFELLYHFGSNLNSLDHFTASILDGLSETGNPKVLPQEQHRG